MKDNVFIICPPFTEYPQPPPDMSKCEAIKCPDCDNAMWLSKKKKAVMESVFATDKQIILACYNCAEIRFKKMIASGELDVNDVNPIHL